MAGQKDLDQLDKAEIDRALQKPVMMAYVPLHTVFVPEIVIIFCLSALIKFWVIALLPLHYVLMIKSEENYFWVNDLIANISDVFMSSNTGIKGKNVITHQPFYARRNKKSDILK